MLSVLEGLLKIAQQFTAGLRVQKNYSPGRTTERKQSKQTAPSAVLPGLGDSPC